MSSDPSHIRALTWTNDFLEKLKSNHVYQPFIFSFVTLGYCISTPIEFSMHYLFYRIKKMTLFLICSHIFLETPNSKDYISLLSYARELQRKAQPNLTFIQEKQRLKATRPNPSRWWSWTCGSFIITKTTSIPILC